MTPLRVLCLSDDVELSRAIEHVVGEEGDAFEGVETVEQAVAAATAAAVDVAFVDLDVEGGASIALCHHLPSLRPGVRVHAVVSPRALDRGSEALSLGASSVIPAPPTGDAIARALSELKIEAARAREVTVLEEKLRRERRRLETYDRLVRFARGATQSDAVRAIVDGVSQVSNARGVALFASFGDEGSERVRLAATGTAVDLPHTVQPADLAHLVSARQARVMPLASPAGELGLLVLDPSAAYPESEIQNVADLAAAMLMLVDRPDPIDESLRIFPARHFRSVADRMLSLALRHDRRASVVAVSLPGGDKPARREEISREISELVRNTDAICGAEEGDLLLFLPETSGLGAHACRRRILARLAGDRRGRPKGAPVRAPDPRGKEAPTSVGVATFPHDGKTLKRLVRAARGRAVDDARSSVYALDLDALPISQVVDALLARPLLDAGPLSPFPLDIACTALFSIVARACRESLRGGEVTVLCTLQPGLGVAAAARQFASPRVLDIRSEPGCENLEAIVVEGEHASWVCCGRIVGERFRGIHAADARLADVLSRGMTAVGGTHAG